MKPGIIILTGLLAAWIAGGAQAADTYQSSLKAGDEARTKAQADAALTEYTAALGQATTNTERALALGKQALVYAYDKKDYTKAAEVAREALEISGAKPVARVTALQALAQCQMKEEEYEAAIVTLNEAIALGGVDWILPTLNLSLGDCNRFTGKNDEAVEIFARIQDMPEATRDIKAIAFLNLGQTYQYGLKDADKAKAAYSKAVELKPSLKEEVDRHTGALP